MMFRTLCFFLIFTSVSSFSNGIDGFWKTEAKYVSQAQSYISQLYELEPELFVVEFSVKRNPTKIESELEHYVFLKAIDIKSIVSSTDTAVLDWAKSNDVNARDVAVYDVIFELPKTSDMSPLLVSVTQEVRFLNNEWARLVKP